MEREEEAAAEEQWIQEYAKYLEEVKLKNPEEYRKIVESLKPTGADGVKLPGGSKSLGADGKIKEDQEGMEITPNEGFVVKTKIIATGQKVFINICQSDLIQKPSNRKQLDENGKEQEGVHIPVSLGPAQKCTDKKGAAATAYDFIVNPQVVNDVFEDKTGGHRNFLVQMCIQYIEQKYKETCDQRYSVLTNAKYKGSESTPQSQRIRKNQAPKIEEVSEENKKKSVKKVNTKAVPVIKREVVSIELVLKVKWNEKSDFVVWSDEHDIQEIPLAFSIQTEMPLISTCKDIQLECGPQMIIINYTHSYKKSEILLPFPINVSLTKCSLDVLNHKFDLYCPVDKIALQLIESQPDPGSKHWLLAAALQDDNEERKEKSKDETILAGASETIVPEFKEDKYHLKLSYPEDEEEGEFQEDKFHKADFMSKHLLDERTKSRLKKEKDNEIKFANQEIEERQKEEEKEAEKLPTVDIVPVSERLSLSTSKSLAIDLLD